MRKKGKMAMSTYSIIGIILIVVVIVVCTIVKIVLKKQRKKLDGVQGFAHRDNPEKTKTDDWELL